MKRRSRVSRTIWFVVLGVFLVVLPTTANERANNLIALLESGKPALGIWTGAISAPRIAKVLATSDSDFIVADIEHDIYDFAMLHRFLLEVQDFHHRFRTEPRPAPTVLVKTGNRGHWDPRYEIAESLKVGLALGVFVPFVESRADVERIVAAVRHAETSLMSGLNLPHDQVDVWPLNPKGEIFVVAMIESPEGVRNAREIMETPGVGAIHTVHISQEDADRIHEMCLERNIVSGTNATPATVKAKVDAGYKLISLGWDFGMLQRQLGDTLKGMREALAK